MRQVFTVGDKKYHEKVVSAQDLASFDSGNVHPVCSTFALAREVEWASRLFVLEMLENFEEGIGTRLAIVHKSPALKGEKLLIEAIISSLEENEIICTISVKVGERVIAECETGQKILAKTKIEELFAKLKNHG